MSIVTELFYKIAKFTGAMVYVIDSIYFSIFSKSFTGNTNAFPPYLNQQNLGTGAPCKVQQLLNRPVQ